ncbi:MAG: TatD family hydrolase [Pseudomonadota bacterium]
MRFTAGVHPHYASEWTDNHYAALRDLMKDEHCVAIGECGLDFNRNFSTPEQQEFAFIQQLTLAQETGKGLYLHERDAWEQQLALLEKYARNASFRIQHCFTGTKHQMQSYLNLGCYIGVTGWICDPKRGVELRESICALPLEKLLVETDAPFLFPKTVKPRSSNNHPRYLIHIIQEIAEIIGVDADIVKRTTEKNALALFDNDKGHNKDT